MMNARYAWWMLLWLLLTSAGVGGESSDQRFLAGLRQRGLFELAETYCVRKLSREDLDDSQRADLVIELSRCLAEWAVASPPDQRAALWERASRVTEDFAGKYPEHPRLLLVRLQQALGHLARGELARQEAQLAADESGLLDQARAHLRVAVRELGELAGDVERRLRERNLPGADPADGLSSHQLGVLQNNIQYQLARAFRNQAQCYAAESPDRTNSFTQAVELLERLAKLDPIDPLSWKSRIDLIASYRLLGDSGAARRQLEALAALKPPPAVELRARAEQIRLALGGDRLAEAISVLSAGRQIEGTQIERITSPELDYAWLETYLAAGRAASHDSAKAAQWQAKATEMVEGIEQLHGPYWTRRAGMLLSRYVRGSTDGGDLDMLVRAAESLFRSRQFDEALVAYDRAESLADKQGDSDRAFDLAYIAAAVEHQRRRHDQALDRYRRLSTGMPEHAKAAEAHELAIYHAAQIAKDDLPGSLDRYTFLLREHLRTWPEGASAERVRRQLGRLREHQHNWQGAIEAYRAISPAAAEFLQAAEAVERCYRAWFAQRTAAGESNEQIAAQAADWFESLVLGPQAQMPQRLSPLQRYAVLAAARLRLNHTAAGHAPAQSVLSAALQTDTDAPPEWKSAARVLLVVSLAGQGRRAEAGQLLDQISAGSTEQLLGMLEGLQRVASTARPEVRGELAQLQLRAIELLPAGAAELSRQQQRALQGIRAQALADTGQTEKSLELYDVLAKTYPRDGAIQEAYAKALSAGVHQARTESARKTSIAAALERWRQLEQKSQPRSRRWFLAKYWIARLQLEQGNKEQAAKMIRLLQLLHPELGGPEMKPQFEELLKRCR